MINSGFIFLLILMTLLGALGGVFFKLLSSPDRNKRLCFLIGGFFYGLGAILNIILLRELPYTVVFPANALTYIWAIIFARWFFKEKIGVFKIAGIGCIFLGIIFLTF